MSDEQLRERREFVFLILAGTFICAMCLLNVVGITRFVDLGPLTLGIGILPYPLTFLCTDVISEIYGRRRANQLVWVGLYLNVLIFIILTVGKLLASTGEATQPPWQSLFIDEPMALPNGEVIEGRIELYDIIYACASGTVFASMVAYMMAQFCDVALFHYFKRLTKGRYLWLRNNFSTLISQFVDSVLIISITFGIQMYHGELAVNAFWLLIFSSYGFKAMTALIDTIPAYIIVHYLSRYLKLDPLKGYEAKELT